MLTIQEASHSEARSYACKSLFRSLGGPLAFKSAEPIAVHFEVISICTVVKSCLKVWHLPTNSFHTEDWIFQINASSKEGGAPTQNL